jgi:hypothetical protein
MRVDRITKILLVLIAILLAANLFSGLFPGRNATAGSGEIGRYQIAAWAAQSGSYTHHSGYYVLDTVTGEVVASKSEVHTAKE